MIPPSRRRGRRLLTLVAGLLAASFALSGCSALPTSTQDPASTASPSPDVTGVDASLLPFYGQTLAWRPCASDGFDCATVRAPLDWADPAKADIELSIIRHRASGGEAIGSLLVNPGGPGASGVGFVRDSLASVGDDLERSFDVVGFDPRGVGESTAVRCFDAAQMDAYLFDIPHSRRGTPEWTQEMLDAARGFGEACDANSGGILPYISTENAARDLDLLRAVLGDTKLNYLGYSYGTLLGAVYADLFPGRAGRLVLDGAVDPSTSMLETGATQMAGFQSALRAYLTDCLSTRDCPFRGTVDDALGDISALLASVDARPLRASDGRRLGADTLVTAILTPLYSRSAWPALTLALRDALQGDPTVAFQLADAYFRRSDGVYRENLTEAFRAYNCMDYPQGATQEERDAATAVVEQSAPTFAPYWVPVDPCEVWPYPSTAVREPIHAAGAAPILVIGTTNDPATPYDDAVALAGQLDSGILVTRVGEGHTGFNEGNSCVDDTVIAFLVDGTVPDGDVRCG